jgi:butyrate kinase
LSARGAAFLGIGAMVGAGIFALLGEAGAVAGSAVWLSFLLAGIVAALLGYTVFKLGIRYPSSGGLIAYLGTNSALDVEARIKQGDKEAESVYYAMAYQTAKGIGELATVVRGKVDVIILTGAIAYSRLFTGLVAERVKFIAPVEIIPGENELEALAFGALRVLRGEESVKEYA